MMRAISRRVALFAVVCAVVFPLQLRAGMADTRTPCHFKVSATPELAQMVAAAMDELTAVSGHTWSMEGRPNLTVRVGEIGREDVLGVTGVRHVFGLQYRAEVVISPEASDSQGVVTHELLHALGLSKHNDDPHSIIHTFYEDGQALTLADRARLDQSGRRCWRLP